MSEHGASIMSTGRHGCWAVCICGWHSQLYTTRGGASLAFAAHMAVATHSEHATAPRTAQGAIPRVVGPDEDGESL